MRLGILLDVQEGIRPEEWRRLGPLVEALGFESLWRSDHLFSLFEHPERRGLECWPSLPFPEPSYCRVFAAILPERRVAITPNPGAIFLAG